MLIDGKWMTAAAGFEGYNPATGEVAGIVPDGSRADASRAFTSWSATTAHARSELLCRAWQLMRERSEGLASSMRMLEGLRFVPAGINDIVTRQLRPRCLGACRQRPGPLRRAGRRC